MPMALSAMLMRPPMALKEKNAPSLKMLALRRQSLLKKARTHTSAPKAKHTPSRTLLMRMDTNQKAIICPSFQKSPLEMTPDLEVTTVAVLRDSVQDLDSTVESGPAVVQQALAATTTSTECPVSDLVASTLE